jgi:murein DD-endopeptidase MepM/ murein hydrolase activator NlpD
MAVQGGLLLVKYPDGKLLRLAIGEDCVIIGRSPQSQIVLQHASVSRTHARIFSVEGQRYLEDLGSTSGTFLDGRRLLPNQPVKLPDGRNFYIGAVRLSLANGRRRWFWPGVGLAAGAVLLILLCIAAIVWQLRLAPHEEVCAEPAMTIIQVGGVPYPVGGGTQTVNSPSPGVAQAGPTQSEPVISTTLPLLETGSPVTATQQAASSGLAHGTAFLELPFPYDGGNENFGGTDEQFRQASLLSYRGGRINSYFDHLLPLYPLAFDGKEPEQFGGKVLMYDGSLRADIDYSGHPGYDFKTFAYRQPTTPVFAAADGVVEEVGVHGASGALYVRLVHHVTGVGDFRTTYWHLHPDEFFEAMKGKEGQAIKAGTRIGTMGNTGFSTGHHLHFEVRFDRNGDGFFSEGERVDPYGFIPNEDFPQDPWVERSAPVSEYLWVHPLGLVAEVPPGGGGSLTLPEGTGGEIALGGVPSLCAPPNSLPASGRLYWLWAPDPPASEGIQGVGRSVVVSVTDPSGNPVQNFDPPLALTIPFDETDLDCMNVDSLHIYWFDPLTQEWKELTTTLDKETGTARATTSRPGKFALMGNPTCDLVPPQTIIRANGVQSPDGTFFDRVTVWLESIDSSGIQKIEFSLDGGSKWSTYQGPFIIEPDGVPAPGYTMEEEFFGLGPGRFLVMAAAVDMAGNQEDPPAFRGILIDPSKNPLYQEITSTPTPTSTATVAPPECARQLTIKTSANCRGGPGMNYPVVKALAADIRLDVLGQNKIEGLTWWLVGLANSPTVCWVSDNLVSLTGDSSAECVPLVNAPATPTATPTATKKTPKKTTPPAPPTTAAPPNAPPSAPDALKPADGVTLGCAASVKLRWSQVSDDDGIKYYLWEVQRSQDDKNGPYVADSSGQTSDDNADLSVDCQTWYRWRVRAMDGSGLLGPYSAWSYFYVETLY